VRLIPHPQPKVGGTSIVDMTFLSAGDRPSGR
jgi:hypothetical protein